jgi:hypothetical protein
MVQQNEFTGATLWEAVRKATAVYDRKAHREDEVDQRRCNDLLLEMSNLSRDATRLADKADRLEDDAEDLRRAARNAGLLAVLGAVGGVASSALKAKRAAKALSRMTKGDLSRDTILDFLTAFSLLGAAAAALFAVQDLLESEKLAREAQELSDSAESMGTSYMQAFNEYKRIGCGVGSRFVGA